VLAEPVESALLTHAQALLRRSHSPSGGTAGVFGSKVELGAKSLTISRLNAVQFAKFGSRTAASVPMNFLAEIESLGFRLLSDPFCCLIHTAIPWAAWSHGVSEALALLRRQTVPAAGEAALAHPAAPATKTAE
jgi:hypothetical protein